MTVMFYCHLPEYYSLFYVLLVSCILHGYKKKWVKNVRYLEMMCCGLDNGCKQQSHESFAWT